MKKVINIIFVLFLFNIYTYANNSLVPFVLEDQFEQEYTQNDFLGKTFILIGASADVVELHKQYKIELAKKIYQTFSNEIKIISVFNMEQVPSLFRYFAMSKFPDEKKKKILIDWTGKLSKDYSFDNNALDILVFNKSGNIIYRSLEKEFDKNNINKVILFLKDIL